MLCTIYKSSKNLGVYLVIAKRNDFTKVPPLLMENFGKTEFVMMHNLNSNKTIFNEENSKIKREIMTKGFYLKIIDNKKLFGVNFE